MAQKKAAHSPTEAVRILWEEGFFATQMTLEDVVTELASRGNNFETGSIRKALMRASFLTLIKQSHVGALSSYVQKKPANLSEAVEDVAAVSGTSGLHTFDVKQTHSFDKFLRSAFAAAHTTVAVADPYADDTIFDNLLDQISRSVEIRLIHNKKQGNYDARVVRFVNEYPKFQTKAYAELHDRFLIIDGVGYVIGPSLKDAARKSPAIVVTLSSGDSVKLQQFFDTLWTRSI